MESPTAVAVFASVLPVKLAEKGFEIYPVDEQARGLLQMVQQVAGQLDDARLLRRQKSALFTEFEKRIFDKTCRHGEDAIRQVASLTERPRLDMQNGGQTSMNTRLVFVLRNSPSLNVSLTQLGIASQSLDAAIMQMNGRDSRPSSSAGSPPTQSPRQGESKPLPTYEESQFLSSGRRKNMQRRATAMGIRTVDPPPEQSVQPSQPDRTRAQSASTLYIPAVPPIPELVGDEAFQERSHHSLPIIRVASAPQPPSDPIVIESEPIASSPARSNSGSQPNISPPRSPPVPRRFNSVSSNSNSDPGAPQSSTFTPPQPAGVQTPPNGWTPQFQETRPPPPKYASTYPGQQPVIMPAPIHYSYPPYPNPNVPHAGIPPIPPQNAARNPWGLEQVQEYRPSSGSYGSASTQEIRPPSGSYGSASTQEIRPPSESYGSASTQEIRLPSGSYGTTSAQEIRPPSANFASSSNQRNRLPPTNLAPSPNIGIGIRGAVEPRRGDFAPYSPDFQAPLSPQISDESDYVYKPSRRGQGGRHRHSTLMESRARV